MSLQVAVVILAGLRMAFCSSDHSNVGVLLLRSVLVVGCDSVPHMVGEHTLGYCCMNFLNLVALSSISVDPKQPGRANETVR